MKNNMTGLTAIGPLNNILGKPDAACLKHAKRRLVIEPAGKIRNLSRTVCKRPDKGCAVRN